MAKIALVCSGGGVAASYEVGIINEFEKAGILDLISIVVGTSAGAINAAVLASGEHDKLMPIWSSLQTKNIYREPKLGAGWAYIMSSPAVYNNDPLRALLETSINFDAIREKRAGKELYIVANDLVSGEKVIFNNDSTSIETLLATTAIPGLFPAIQLDGMLLVDGGTESNCPIGAAIQAGADIIICLMTEPSNPSPVALDKLKTFVDRMIRGADISIRKNVRNDIRVMRLKNREEGKKRIKDFVIGSQKRLPAALLDFCPEKISRTIAQGEEDARLFLSEHPNFKEFLTNYTYPPIEKNDLQYRVLRIILRILERLENRIKKHL